MTIWTEVAPGLFVNAGATGRKRTTPYGEEYLCRSCARRGYGEDAWQPCTSEFWPTIKGKLWFGRCRACNEDLRYRMRGIVPANDADVRAIA